MRRTERARRRAVATSVVGMLVLVGTAWVGTGVSNAGARCAADPDARLATVPAPEQFLGFPLGVGQERLVTVTETNDYLAAVDAASPRVVTGSLGTSVNGRPIPYAVIAGEQTMGRLDEVARQVRALRDPRTTGTAEAARIAADTPGIVWVMGNVHGQEGSGTDAALSTLYTLASGLSCEVRSRLDNVVTVVVPVQNPDGREANSRDNAYGIDLNRDWFAATQPETTGKLELMRRFPPQVVLDAHEMDTSQFFFPPDADPRHHETPSLALDWSDQISAANEAAFGYNGACGGDVAEECYVHYTFDPFFLGYSDTTASIGFGAAGLLYEKGAASPVPVRVDQQARMQWSALGWAADHRRTMLDGYYRTWREAIAQGRAGTLQPNQVRQPGNTVLNPVPEVSVRSYFLLPDRQLADARQLVERLRRMDVEVYRLDAPLVVPHAQVIGGGSASDLTVPAGAYWIPLDQPQKHWIQAMLGEDSYQPVPSYYDVLGWSAPLLAGLHAIRTGERLAPRATRVTGSDGGVVRTPAARSYGYPLDSEAAAQLTFRLLGRGVPVSRDQSTGRVSLPAAGAPADLDALSRSFGVTVTPASTAPTGAALRLPRVGVLTSPRKDEGSGSAEARYVLESRWGLSVRAVSYDDVDNNSFADLDTLVVPAKLGRFTFKEAAQANLRSWLDAGGTYLGFGGYGVSEAMGLGVMSSTMRRPLEWDNLGTSYRVTVDRSSPVGLGRPDQDVIFHDGFWLLEPSTTGTNLLRYPTGDAFWVAGAIAGTRELEGTVAAVDEPVGQGRAVLFTFNPLFRGYATTGMQLVANALLAPPATGPAAKGADHERAVDEARRAAQRASDRVTGRADTVRPITVAVRQADGDRLVALVRRYTDAATVVRSDGSVRVRIPNPDALTPEEHPFLRRLLTDVRAAGLVPAAPNR